MDTTNTVEKNCYTCKHRDLSSGRMPCRSCIDHAGFTGWEPQDTPDKPEGVSDGGSTDYYKLPSDATDLQDLIEFREMNFSIGNIFKACYRLGLKKGNKRAYELRKIIFFANRELARVMKEEGA